MKKKYWKRFWGMYLMALHVFLALMLWKSEVIPKMMRRVGYVPSLSISDAEIASATSAQHYKNMQVYYTIMDLHNPEGVVLFIGDSMIQCLSVATVTESGINFGIGGDTSTGLLLRLDKYVSLPKAKAIVLEIGVNDLSTLTNAQIVQNFKKIAHAIPSTIPLVWSSIFPLDERFVNKEKWENTRIRELNAEISEICQARARCVNVNPWQALIDETGNLNLHYHVGDGIHLNARGYRLWIEHLKTALNMITEHS